VSTIVCMFSSASCSDISQSNNTAYVLPAVGKTQCATTFAYLNSSNLSTGWTQFNPYTHQYTSREYSACPTIRRE
jgi:hypothetical protein